MKDLLARLFIGVWLLLPSAGTVLAADPQIFTGTQGQPGFNKLVSCNSGLIDPGLGDSVNANDWLFNPSVAKKYAGNPGTPTVPEGTANASATHAAAQYDVACFQHSQLP